ncbi:MAG: toll/interleukin-1 receptor domain-containing protein [Bacteroidales bacterium]|nr:toll/interleukin-1 receptor domain-containing protein [Bacteroidales bacterium]
MAKYDVFISYSRRDTETVRKICSLFDANGISYFIDVQGIGGALEFPDVLAQAILDSRIILFVASRNSYDSKFTKSEITFAFNKKPKESILPYIIDGSALPPGLELVFSNVNISDIHNTAIGEPLLKDMLKLLGREKSQTSTASDQATLDQYGLSIFSFDEALTSGIVLYRGRVYDVNLKTTGRGRITVRSTQRITYQAFIEQYGSTLCMRKNIVTFFTLRNFMDYLKLSRAQKLPIARCQTEMSVAALALCSNRDIIQVIEYDGYRCAVDSGADIYEVLEISKREGHHDYEGTALKISPESVAPNVIDGAYALAKSLLDKESSLVMLDVLPYNTYLVANTAVSGDKVCRDQPWVLTAACTTYPFKKSEVFNLAGDGGPLARFRISEGNGIKDGFQIPLDLKRILGFAPMGKVAFEFSVALDFKMSLTITPASSGQSHTVRIN